VVHLEAIAKDTEYYQIERSMFRALLTIQASATVYLFHKKHGASEEYWEIRFILIRENRVSHGGLG
jgi:hypothetical protein